MVVVVVTGKGDETGANYLLTKEQELKPNRVGLGCDVLTCEYRVNIKFKIIGINFWLDADENNYLKN